MIGFLKMIFGGVRDIMTARLDAKKAAAEKTAALLRDKNRANSSWEMAQITDSDKLLRRLSFCILFAPLVWEGISPGSAGKFFAALQHDLPPWYLHMILGVVGSIWGLSSLKHTVPSIVDGMRRLIKK